ncbi:uncharacterized protein C20orf173 homolog isoform X2 [Talpa occidentalis]|uniref:uncharacterized protein C20orf173 homolog isoform X2 n=1 Tax=Talpa occidentalis TaxID=50954 RepID=UPI00188E3537|nr:uncharacterized protein C20orf173 homolog isoform X2 [Talpa occidentalis]
MKNFWQIFVTWVLCVIILWLMAPYLDLEPELAPQEKSLDLVPWHGNCPWIKFRKCHYPTGTLNYSLCHHAVREWNWFDACYEKMMGILMRAKESKIPGSMPWWLDMNSARELGKVWKKFFKEIPRPSMSHFDLYCGTCALVGNSKILWASNIGKNINHHTRVFRNQTPIQDLVMVGNQTGGRFIYHKGVRGQGSWRQLVLLLLKLSGLVWTSNTLSEEILEDGLMP